MDTLFYDGRCPLCKREVATLKRLQSGGLGFADIHHSADAVPAQMPSREALLRRLHLLTAEGHWIVGLQANVRAWSHTRIGWLFRPLLWPGIHGVARRVYERWADRRYDKRYACGPCSGSDR